MAFKEAEFDRFRGNVEHEDNLINHRTSWLLISQSFLLGACVASGKYPYPVKLVGTIISVASACSVAAAIWALADIRKKTIEGFEGCVPPLMSSPFVHKLGLVAPVVVHILYIMIWWFV